MTRAATLGMVVARLATGVLFLLTAMYALLVYLPFCYTGAGDRW